MDYKIDLGTLASARARRAIALERAVQIISAPNVQVQANVKLAYIVTAIADDLEKYLAQGTVTERNG